MIIDSHSHIFPYLGSAAGLESESTHLMYFQRAIAGSPATPVRKLEDSSLVTQWSLWDKDNPGPKGCLQTDLRVGRYGRIEWKGLDGDCYVSLYAPSLQDMIAPPEYMLAEMDLSGVEMTVLQNAWLYGQLNDYFSEAVKKYPNRFIGTVQVDEAEGYKDKQITELRRAVTKLGLRGGLYFANLRLFENNFKESLDDEKFFPLWEEIDSLGIPIYWDISPLPIPGKTDLSLFDLYSNQMKQLDKILVAFPNIPSILVHGVQLRVFTNKNEFTGFPDEILKVWKRPNVLLEILFPIQVSYPRPGSSPLDYPYEPVRPIIRELYKTVGAEKLIWGSDMPNVLRNCTYAQTLEYLRRYCTFIAPSDMEKIIGGNIARLYGL